MSDHVSRFWAKVNKTEGCWEWTAYKDRNGYGQLTIKRTGYYAHRAAWQFAKGPIPDGMSVDHTCHNPACVRIDHLRLVNHKQNQENRMTESRSSSGFRGVYWNKRRGDWEAKVCHERRSIHVGFFADLEDAKAAVIAKRLELFTHNDADRAAA